MKGRRRRCRTCTVRNLQFPPLPTEEQIKRVTAALNAGKRVHQICGNRNPERIFGFNKLKVLRQTDATFDQLYRTRILTPRRAGPLRLVKETRCYRLPSGNIRNRPAGFLRFAAPCSRRRHSIDLPGDPGSSLQRDQVKDRVKDYIRAHYRDANRGGVGKYGMVSLDAPIRADRLEAD